MQRVQKHSQQKSKLFWCIEMTTVNRKDRIMIKADPQTTNTPSQKLAEHFRAEMKAVNENNKSPIDLQRDRAIYQPRGSQ